MNFCIEAKSKKEIMEYIGVTDSKNFREKYLKPLIAVNLIAMTIPDKPTSRYQKYVRVGK